MSFIADFLLSENEGMDGLAGSGCQQDGLKMLMVCNSGHELSISSEEVFMFFPQAKGTSHGVQIVHTFMHDA